MILVTTIVFFADKTKRNESIARILVSLSMLETVSDIFYFSFTWEERLCRDNATLLDASDGFTICAYDATVNMLLANTIQICWVFQALLIFYKLVLNRKIPTSYHAYMGLLALILAVVPTVALIATGSFGALWGSSRCFFGPKAYEINFNIVYWCQFFSLLLMGGVLMACVVWEAVRVLRPYHRQSRVGVSTPPAADPHYIYPSVLRSGLEMRRIGEDSEGESIVENPNTGYTVSRLPLYPIAEIEREDSSVASSVDVDVDVDAIDSKAEEESVFSGRNTKSVPSLHSDAPANTCLQDSKTEFGVDDLKYMSIGSRRAIAIAHSQASGRSLFTDSVDSDIASYEHVSGGGFAPMGEAATSGSGESYGNSILGDTPSPRIHPEIDSRNYSPGSVRSVSDVDPDPSSAQVAWQRSLLIKKLRVLAIPICFLVFYSLDYGALLVQVVYSVTQSDAWHNSFLEWSQCAVLHYNGRDESWQAICGSHPAHRMDINLKIAFNVFFSGQSIFIALVYSPGVWSYLLTQYKWVLGYEALDHTRGVLI